MKKVIYLLTLVLFFSVSAEAQTRKKTSKTKKTTTSVLPVTKGAVNEYGDDLTTQIFTIKKGKENKIVIEYPIAGNPQLVRAMRQYIKNSLNDKFTGSLESPEALLRDVMKTKKDVSFGQEGESIEQEIFVTFHNPDIITLEDKGYSYMGGAHGMPWSTGATFLKSDGTELSKSMFPSISRMRPYILEGLGKYFEVSPSQLSGDYIFGNANEIDYPAVPFIVNKDGINFIYQPYEISPFSSGIPVAIVQPTAQILEMLTPAGRRFFNSIEPVNSKATGEIYTIVEQNAVFPGGDAALMKWVAENISYPENAYMNSIQGRVLVKFVIETDGSISNVSVVKGVDPELDAEAIQVVKKMPKWTPGKNRGIPVRSYFTLPVTFKI